MLRELRPLVGEDEKLAKAFLGVINDDGLRKMAQEGEEPFRIKSLEDTTMLAQRVERIRDGLIETGKREGKREEAEQLFLKLYTVKNGGPVPAKVRQLADESKLEQLETWAERLLTVQLAEEVFDD